MKKSEIALQLLKDGYNCAQAVSTAFSEDLGVHKETTARMACALGAGMSRCGEVCGAVSGALMITGLKHGSSKPEDKIAKEKSYKTGKEFIKMFETKHGTIICRKLIEMDISTPEGLEAAHKKGVFENICKGLVKDAVEIIEKII